MNNLQKPNIYNEYSPFNESIKQYGLDLFDEIRENLSRTIQLGELNPGLLIWSRKLTEFILKYGFYFSKVDHLKLINLYLSILSITDLNYIYVQLCFDMLRHLLRKTRLITRDDLEIDWRILYYWARLINDNHDKIHGLVILPSYIDGSLALCVTRCSPYFSAIATQEILDELRPQMCPMGGSFAGVMRMFSYFLPVNLPPNLHYQGFQLWLSEFFNIWQNIYNQDVWRTRLIDIFSSVAWHNIGYIDWEPWMSQIFTRILRGFSLPMGKLQETPQKYPHFVPEVAKWIVAMIGNRSSCLQYLADLLISIRSFYHPTNMGTFQKNLVEFLLKLTTYFVDRVHLERKAHPVWSFTPLSSYRLTEENITDFVNCLKEYVFISIFNQTYMETAVEACHYLSILRPELIIPFIVEKHFLAIDSMTEPHRFTSIITCLTHIARQIVQQTPSYSQGQTYVLPLLISVLPGIDLNDFKKTSVTLEFLDTMLMQITCIDCSSAVNIRNDLTEIEREVCLSTSKFEDFINEFLNRIFHIIEISSAEISDAVTADANDNTPDIDIQPKVTSILFNIVQQCSSPIFQKIREKIMNFLSSQCLSPKVRDIASGLVRALVKGNPVETLKYLLPEICKSIENKFNNSESTLLTDYKDDIELTWYLVVFAELLRARGDVLLIYKQLIMSVFHQFIQIVNKNSYNAVAKAVINLLESLSCSYPVDYRLLVINSDETFDNFLPIRLWGQYVDIDKVQPQFHIPSIDEIDFVYEFVEIFLYPELARLNENGLKMSNNERLRSLTIIRSIAVGAFCFVPPIESKEVRNLMVQSMVPHYSKYQIRLSKNSTELKYPENLRLRLFIDIGLFLDKLVENHSGDVLSIQKALGFYRLISSYYGIYEHGIYDWSKDFNSREKLSKNKLCGEGQNLRFLIIQKMALKIKELETTYYGPLNEINKEIIFKLFELSINRYSAVRRNAQNDLFYLFNRIPFSYQVIVDRIVELLKSTSEHDHDQIKV
ncbi:unnamed protein product [Adineta steineri]|uniref:Proteasome activator Blm10 middle HEAT repeats region domain-containing protein n=1 Tax=Adineta steineri TaxID=433720 RepID=A0A813VVJ4_9BILA|nr:unnamed protein product [Adineta steineri]CAF1434426.1 unnamed protein product [Adineta steineri]